MFFEILYWTLGRLIKWIFRLQPEGLEMKAIPASTVLSVYAMNSIFAEAIALMHGEGIEAPLYVSGNIPGGREKNRRLIEKYSPRIRHL